jgi:hypothetical protein
VQVVAVQEFAEVAAIAVQDDTAVGALAFGPVPQVVWTQSVAALAATGVHEATGVGPVGVAAPQVWVFDVVHACPGTGVVQPQVVLVQLLPTMGADGVQPEGALVGPESTVVQVVVIQLLVEDAVAATQEPVGVGPTTVVGQIVVVQELVELAVTGVQDTTPVGPVLTGLQLVVM